MNVLSVIWVIGAIFFFLFILLTDYRLNKINRSLKQLVELAEEFAEERNKETDA
jgi:F0F1-type ATP synthase membrane subunit a